MKLEVSYNWHHGILHVQSLKINIAPITQKYLLIRTHKGTLSRR